MSLREVQIAAAKCLLAVESGKNLHQALLEVQHGNNFSMQEYAQLMDISYGTQRFLGSIQFYLNTLVKRPIPDKTCDAILRVVLYQLSHTRNMEHAVVNEAVSASSRIANGKYKSLVNAVLRRFLREKQSIQKLAQNDCIARDNFPLWWLKRLEKDYPQDARKIIESAAIHPPMTLRVNCRKTCGKEYISLLKQQNIDAVLLDDYAIRLDKGVPVSQLPHFADGFVSVQDFGAQRAAHILDVKDGEMVLDACCAPGGKTTHILELANCNMTALDIDNKRLSQVADNLSRLGFQAKLIASNAANLQEWFDGKLFDAILADVPCTASGVVRRNPDIKWLRRPNDAAKTANQQIPLLDNLWSCLKTGGRMLLATCSIFQEENTHQKDAFLLRNPDASCKVEEILLPNENHDGFYYALLEKN
ncbi:MAG: 16S rRNA (cytosine(967)-C(5))-methyltransferase RsmB [Neisseriaceae bacterium]|nr:16S rRNA (cytosine(967)-C(5))-methyltransferase RsmB [Neisseriaceae bacterium]